MKNRVLEVMSESTRLVEMAKSKAGALVQTAEFIAHAFATGRKLMVMGNGGSAAHATHMAAEFVNRFKIERPPLPAISLGTDASIITSVANDYSFNEIFAKQIKALGQEGDIVIGLSTSGKSPNVLEGLRAARAGGMVTIAFTGAGGGLAGPLADLLLVVDSMNTPRIQEIHHLWVHIICDLVDYILFQKPSEEG